MTPSIIIQFDRHEFQPQETITGTFRLLDITPAEIQHLEFSILWFTEGKGDEDLGVHFFKTLNSFLTADELPEAQIQTPEPPAEIQETKETSSGFFSSSQDKTETQDFVQQVFSENGEEKMYHFSVKLPPSPLSYHGKILKIHWCARVRLFPKTGREVKSERRFLVGKVPPIQVQIN